MATIKDIAQRAGVSIGTVDRIIHRRGRYSEKTAARVQAIIEELNYSPNIHARGLKKTRNYTFGAVVPNVEQEAGYWRLAVAGIERAAEELSQFSVNVEILQFDRYSEQSCREVLTGALESGVDGLLIAPVLPGIVKEQLSGIDIPFLFIDTDIPEMTRRISYIGQDSYQSGVLSGRLMSLLLSSAGVGCPSGPVLAITPPGSNYHLRSRVDGFRSFMHEHRSDREIEVVEADSDDEARFHKVLDAYFAAVDVQPSGIFAANSLVYYAASFLKMKGPEFCRIPLIGYDLIPGGESFIEDGIIDFILTQQPEQQAYRGIMMLYDVLVLNKNADKSIIVPLNIITRENINTFTGV